MHVLLHGLTLRPVCPFLTAFLSILRRDNSHPGADYHFVDLCSSVDDHRLGRP